MNFRFVQLNWNDAMNVNFDMIFNFYLLSNLDWLMKLNCLQISEESVSSVWVCVWLLGLSSSSAVVLLTSSVFSWLSEIRRLCTVGISVHQLVLLFYCASKTWIVLDGESVGVHGTRRDWTWTNRLLIVDLIILFCCSWKVLLTEEGVHGRGIVCTSEECLLSLTRLLIVWVTRISSSAASLIRLRRRQLSINLACIGHITVANSWPRKRLSRQRIFSIPLILHLLCNLCIIHQVIDRSIVSNPLLVLLFPLFFHFLDVIFRYLDFVLQQFLSLFF